MRVLHVEAGRHLYGGAQQVLYLLQGLAEAGVTNSLVCPRDSDLARAAAGLAMVHELTMAGDLDLRLIPRLARLMGRAEPDLVHLHSRSGADVMGGIAARLRGVPVVCSRRVDNPEPRWLLSLKHRLFDRVVAISAGIARVQLAAGLPAAKLRVVRSAVDDGAFDIACDRSRVAAALGVPAEGLWVGVVAQLIPRKGHGYLLAALPELLADFPQLQLILFGQGPAEADIRADLAAAGLSGCVHLLGFRRDLPQSLSCLDLLVHPATMEGLGVSLLQAASASVPIVASRVGGIPEAVADGRTGLLVPPGDVAALAQACRALLGDRERRRQMGEAGRRRMQAEFSVAAMAAGNLEVYRELLAGNGADRPGSATGARVAGAP